MRLFLFVVSVLLCTTRAYTDHIPDQIAQVVHLLNDISASINNTCRCLSIPLNDTQIQGNANESLHKELDLNEMIPADVNSSGSTNSEYPTEQPAVQYGNDLIDSNLSGANKSAPDMTTSKSRKFKIHLTKAWGSENSLCITMEGEDGKCVKPQDCTIQPHETDNTTLLTYRRSSCTFLLQCCPLDKIKKAPKTNTLLNQCGWIKSAEHILEHAEEFPWTVSIHTKWFEISFGILIHPSVVLSEGYLIFMDEAVRCRAKRSTSKGHVTNERDVEKIVKGEFNARGTFGYANLLFLKSPFILSETPAIGVACLARNDPPLGTSCTAVARDDVLKSACSFTAQVPLKSMDPNESNACLDLVHQGSPLICPLQADDSGKRYVVYGIKKYHMNYFDRFRPFVALPAMIDWIDSQMVAVGADKTTYTV